MLRRVLLAVLVLGLVACGDDVTAPTPLTLGERIAGTYYLQSYNRHGVPVVTSEIGDPVRVMITEGNVFLDADLTRCSFSLTTVRFLEDGTDTWSVDRVECTYTFDAGVIAGVITLAPTVGGTASGTLIFPSAVYENARLIVTNDEGTRFAFERIFYDWPPA